MVLTRKIGGQSGKSAGNLNEAARWFPGGTELFNVIKKGWRPCEVCGRVLAVATLLTFAARRGPSGERYGSRLLMDHSCVQPHLVSFTFHFPKLREFIKRVPTRCLLTNFHEKDLQKTKQQKTTSLLFQSQSRKLIFGRHKTGATIWIMK